MHSPILPSFAIFPRTRCHEYHKINHVIDADELMATSHRDLDHWINGRRVADILFPVLILQFIPYVVGQPGNGSSSDESIPRVPVVVLGPLVFALVFSMLICCFCYKFCDSLLVTTDEVESGVRRGLHRRTGHGLDTEVIGSFPCFLYSEVKGFKMGKGRVECAVCLNEFADHETLRLMPPCSHVFHADCIDVWLSSRSTCPVCRANLYPEPGESFPYPFIDPNTNQSMDPESGNTGRRVQESPERRLIDNVTWMNQHRPPRSRSTGLSSWRIADMIFPRSRSTGHSLVQPCENLDRFTLQLPKEVHGQLIRLNRSKSHMALPQARSSRSSYRSGSVGSQMSTFPNGRQNNQSAISLSFPFSFSPNSTQSSPSRSDPAALAKGSIKTNQLSFQKKIQGKDEISVNGHSNGSGQID